MDGPTVGAAGGWRAVIFGGASNASVLQSVEVRFAGQGLFSSVDLNDSDATFTNVTIRDGAVDGLSLSNNSFPSVTGRSFIDNVGADTTVIADNLLGGSLVMAANMGRVALSQSGTSALQLGSLRSRSHRRSQRFVTVSRGRDISSATSACGLRSRPLKSMSRWSLSSSVRRRSTKWCSNSSRATARPTEVALLGRASAQSRDASAVPAAGGVCRDASQTFTQDVARDAKGPAPE